MARPSERDLHEPFETWGVFVEAAEKGGFPHKERTYWVNGVMVYDSHKPAVERIETPLRLTYLAIEEFLHRQGEFARYLCHEAYVRQAYWVDDDGKYARKFRRLTSWKEAGVLRIVRSYHYPSKRLQVCE